MLGDQFFSSKNSFTGSKGDLDVTVFMECSDDQSILVIELRNQTKMEFFRLKIDQNHLLDNADMSFCFETPEDLFYTLMELFQEVRVSQEGILTFQMKLNASKLKKKVFRIEIPKVEVDPNEMMRVKLENLKRELKAESSAKDEKIDKLTKRTVELEKSMELMKEEVAEMKREAEQLSLEYKKKDFKMNSIVKESDLQRQQIGILRKSLQEFHKKFSLLQFYNFFDNPHWHYFSVYRGDQSVIIIKKDSDSLWHSFIRNVPLAEGKTYQFKVKQKKTNYRNIMVGVTTRQGFGQELAYKSASCVAYNSYSGNVWEKGSSRKGGAAVNDGQTITVEINLMDHRVIWFVEGKKAAESALGNSFKNKEVYLCLQFYNVQDQLELMLY